MDRYIKRLAFPIGPDLIILDIYKSVNDFLLSKSVDLTPYQDWIADGNVGTIENYIKYLASIGVASEYSVSESLRQGVKYFKLLNDEDNPGALKYYGTNEAGVKGFHPFPELGGGNSSPYSLIAAPSEFIERKLLVTNDGTIWNSFDVFGLESLGGVSFIKNIGSTYFLSGYETSSSNQVLAYSKDLINWITISLPDTTYMWISDLIYLNGIYIAANDNLDILHPLYYSNDGLTWTGVDNLLLPNCKKVINNNDEFLAVGVERTQGTPNSTVKLITSSDGINWSNKSSISIPGFYAWVEEFTYINNIYVLILTRSGNVENDYKRTTRIYTSIDAITWTEISWLNLHYSNNLLYKYGKYYVTGFPNSLSANKCIYYSEDLINWTYVNTDDVVRFNDSAVLGTKIIVGGLGATNDILTSSDGLIWDKVSVDDIWNEGEIECMSIIPAFEGLNMHNPVTIHSNSQSILSISKSQVLQINLDAISVNDGKSAYEIAVNLGFVGTEAEWIASLQGSDGKSVYEIALELGFVGDQAAFIASLKGDPGNDGADGADGTGVYIGFASDDLGSNFSTTPSNSKPYIGFLNTTAKRSLANYLILGRDADYQGQILYSEDAVSWHKANAVAPDYQKFINAKFNGSLWIATCSDQNHSIFYSKDGINWQEIPVPIAGAKAHSIGWNGQYWLLGTNGSDHASFYKSLDGLTWTPVNTKVLPYVFAMDWNGSMWVAVGNAELEWNGSEYVAVAGTEPNLAAYSLDGENWTGLGLNLVNGPALSVCWKNSKWIIGSSYSYMTPGYLTTNNKPIAYSSDGINWTTLTFDVGMDNLVDFTAIATNGTIYVATGSTYGTDGIVYTSTDGINWNHTHNEIFSWIIDIKFDGSKFIGIGGDASNTFDLIESVDGITWTKVVRNDNEVHGFAVKYPYLNDKLEVTDFVKWVRYVGADGKSAYQVAVDNGFVGTEEEWLASLRVVAIDQYVALVSQAGAAVPTANVLENAIGAITISKVGVGTFNFVSAGLFTADKTVPYDDIMQDQLGNLYTLNWIDVNTIQLKTYAAADITVLADGVLNKRYICFKVYRSI